MAAETRVSDEVEIASKKIQIGRKNYYVDLKKNQKGMFIKFVEVLIAARASRIVIPMSVADQFYEKLLEIKNFVDSYEHPEVAQNVEKTEDKFANTIKSANLFVLNRRFYFDLKESARGSLILRISLVSSTNRINISILAEAVSSVADIIGEFLNSHPYTPSGVRTTSAAGPRRPVKNGQNANVTPAIKSEPVQKSEQTERALVERPQRYPKKSLVVLSDPAPEVFTVDGRTYTFELVSGEEHTFVRVCEQKNFRKSTMHIPLDLCEKWMDTCGSFVKSIPVSAIEAALKSKSTATPTTS